MVYVESQLTLRGLPQAVAAERPQRQKSLLQPGKRGNERQERLALTFLCRVKERRYPPLRKLAGIHIPHAVGEVVRLVDEEDRVVFARGRIKIPPQIYRRIEGVVVIADDEVAVFRQVERQLVGADKVLLRRLGYDLGRVSRAGRNEVGDREREPLIVPLRVGTLVGIAEG